MKTLLFNAVTQAQNALAKWIVPDSKITDAEVLSELVGILDDKELVKAMCSPNSPPQGGVEIAGKLNLLQKSTLEKQYEKETNKKHWTNPVSHGEYAFPTDDYVNWLMKKIIALQSSAKEYDELQSKHNSLIAEIRALKTYGASVYHIEYDSITMSGEEAYLQSDIERIINKDKGE